MKTAKLSIQTVAVVCPICGEPITETEHGSQQWEVGQLTAGKVLTCACGSRCKIPSGIRGERL